MGGKQKTEKSTTAENNLLLKKKQRLHNTLPKAVQNIIIFFYYYNFIYYEQKVEQANKCGEQWHTILGIKGMAQKFLGSSKFELKTYYGTSGFIIWGTRDKMKNCKGIMGTCTNPTLKHNPSTIINLNLPSLPQEGLLFVV